MTKSVELSSDQTCFKQTGLIIHLVNKYDQVFTALNLDRSIITALKTLFIDQKNKNIDLLAKIQLAWRTANKKIYEERFASRTLVESKSYELLIKEVHLRDEFIVVKNS